jgi:hypothetical protein
MMEIFLFLDAIRTCLDVSLQQYATIDRPLLSMGAQFNLELDTWVGKQTSGSCQLALITVHIRLSFNGQNERRNSQYFRCIRVIWYASPWYDLFHSKSYFFIKKAHMLLEK